MDDVGDTDDGYKQYAWHVNHVNFHYMLFNSIKTYIFVIILLFCTPKGVKCTWHALETHHITIIIATKTFILLLYLEFIGKWLSDSKKLIHLEISFIRINSFYRIVVLDHRPISK